MPLAPRRTSRSFTKASDPLASIGRMRILGASIDRTTNKGYVRIANPSGSFLNALGKPANLDVAVSRYGIDDLIAAERAHIRAQSSQSSGGSSIYNNLSIDRARVGQAAPETSLTDFIAHCICLINAKGDELGKPQPKR